MAAIPPQGPAGRKNSAISRPVAYPPPMTTALNARPGNTKRWNALEECGCPAKLLTGIEQSLERRSAAHGVRDRQCHALRHAVDFALCTRRVEPGGVQADSGAADRGIRE